MKIAVILNPSHTVGSSNEATNIIRHRPDVFLPVASQSIGGKPGLQEVDTLYGTPFYYPVSSMLVGLNKLDPDAILICTVGRELFGYLPKILERWPVVWRANVNPLEYMFDPTMMGHVQHFFNVVGGVDAIVACTRFVEENLNHLGIFNTTTIPTCLDTKECPPAKPSSDLVITLTRMAPIKNILYSILSMVKVLDDVPSAVYRIYGSGMMAPFIQDLLRKLGAERISFEGPAPANWILPRAKVFLQTSISENFSLSVLEAMASGIPVVASDIPGHAVGNVYFESVKQISEEVKKLLTDDELWKKRREDGFEKVKEFDVRKIVPRWEKLFETVIKLKKFKKKTTLKEKYMQEM